MRTVKELTKLPPTAVAQAISSDIKNEIDERIAWYKTDYLDRHPKFTDVPEAFKTMHKELANYYTLAQVETLLSLAIQHIQQGETEIEALKQELYHINSVPPEDWDKKMKDHGIR